MYSYHPVNKPLEKGFSLIEFMIAITISMVVLLAVSIAWQSGIVTQKAQSDASRLNETVGFAINLLSREIKQAGLINKATTPPEYNFCSTATAPATGAAIAGVNDPTTFTPTATVANLANAGAVTVSNKSDVIRVRYYGENSGAGGTAGGTSLTSDCLGNQIGIAGVPYTSIVEDTLYIASDPNNNNEPALWCYSSNPTSTAVETGGNSNGFPIVAGVESMQILYGEDIDGDGIINHYVPAGFLTTSFDNVLSVKVSIVARSADAVVPGPAATKTYYHFGQPPPWPANYQYVDPSPGAGAGTTIFTSPSDNRFRLPQPLSTEIAVRNFSNCSAQF